jgi:hypothetical protein
LVGCDGRGRRSDFGLRGELGGISQRGVIVRAHTDNGVLAIGMYHDIKNKAADAATGVSGESSPIESKRFG